MFLSIQAVLLFAGWCYIYRTDAALLLLMFLYTISTFNAIFSDAMSEKSRRRMGSSVMILGIIFNMFSVIIWKLAPASTIKDTLELPGSAWLRAHGYHAITMNPVDFCVERSITLIIFFTRFFYTQYYYPNAALNIQVLVLHHMHPLVVPLGV